MDSIPTPRAKPTRGPSEPSVSKLDKIKAEVTKSVTSLRTLLNAVKAPLPTETGNGTALPPKAHIDNAAEKFGTICKDAASIGLDTLPKLMEAANAMASGQVVNDKKYYMEAMIEAAAKLPDDFVCNQITDKFVTTLWTDMQHPAPSLMGEDYQFRQPDGSKNSYQKPHVGAAGQCYARTVAPKTCHSGSMPDPGVLFDTLMARKEPVAHPNRISSMLFYWASIIIHDVFRTDHKDFRVSGTSSYLDLAPLYGGTWKDQKRMRTFKDGKIKPDCFSEPRLLAFPPGVGAILIMFNRYHNYVVEQLASINEGGRFTASDKTVERYGETINKRDDDLFQTGRLVVCGLYINIVLIDYVRTILNLNRTDSDWQLNPRKDVPGLPQATGNQVSAEFNLVYRWHNAVSTRDEKWTEELSAQMWGGRSMSDVPQYELIMKLAEIQGATEKAEPNERQFPALDREAMERIKVGPYKGNYKDDDLAKILTESIEDCANAMGPQQIPMCLRAVEILGIQQARTWQLATLNEFRKYFRLEPHRKFSDITSNIEVQEALKHLYDTPDNVELYPGLVVEDAKDPKLPGSGLCPGYTTSRGVLSDAVALVRGDRFYTTDYTPAALTSWGYQEVSSDLTIDNGCVFYKLFLRTLPNNYDPASIYVHYPMTIPSETRTILKDLGKDKLYNLDKPTATKAPIMIFSHKACVKVFEDQDTYRVPWGRAMEFLMGPDSKTFMLAGDGPDNAKSRTIMEKAMFQGASSRGVPKGNEKWTGEVKTFYEYKTKELLKAHSYKLGKLNQVDLIRDVSNLTHVHFASQLFNLPLKTKESPHGVFTEQQLYLINAAVFTCVFFDIDPAKSFPLRQQARAVTQQLGQLLAVQVKAIKSGGAIGKEVMNHFHSPTRPELQAYGTHMIQQLLKEVDDVDKLVWGNLMGTCSGMVANQGQLFGQILDFIFTNKEARALLPEMTRLAHSDLDEDFNTLMGYMLEFSRLNGESGVFRAVAKATTLTDPLNDNITHNLQPGDSLMLNLRTASYDPKIFPSPKTINPHRDVNSYLHLGHGVHACLGAPMTRVALTQVLKTILHECPNIRPAQVAVGRQSGESFVKKVAREVVPGDLERWGEEGVYHAFLTEDWGMEVPFPTSLKVNWD